jgi:hypothetical protein
VKILDFGIVKLMERSAEFSSGSSVTQSHTEIGVVMGTAGYMSPEQARGLTVDERTDIWSLGVVLYEMLAHRAPFAGETRMDTMVAILEREPPPLFSFRNGPIGEFETLRRIVGKTLSKDKNERYQNALELAADLKSVRQALSPLLGQESVVDVLRGPEKSHSAKQTLAQASQGQFDESDSSVASATVSTQPAARRNAARLLIIVGFLLAVAAGTYIYRHSVAPAQVATTGPDATASNAKLYTQMSETEQLAFVRQQEQRISAMMGDRPVKLSDEAVRMIKALVDRYVARDETGPGQVKLSTLYGRAAPYIPLIARSFTARKVPVIIGIYLPMVESAYHPCPENSFGARGLFQFLPETARNYGVSREEMCDAEKMAPAAAAYIADRMAELGDDAESMTLVLLTYNRGDTSVRDTLRELRDTDGFERNFWTLFAHRDKLDESFRRESAYYVPNFLAAAIIGENPETFGLQSPPLSTLTK